MSWFKFNWFSSKEREELQLVKQENNSLKNQLEFATRDKSQDQSPLPYRNIYFSNGNITVVFYDGTMVSKSNCDKQLFEEVRSATTKERIEFLLTSQKIESMEGEETIAQKQLVASNLSSLERHPDFIVAGSKVFMKGVNLELPSAVAASFIELAEKMEATPKDAILKEQYKALKMFWLKLALNPLPQSREDLLVFVTKNDVRITRNGNLVLYRRIVSKGKGNQELVAFVSQQYYKIKKIGGDPRQFAVIKGVSGNGYNLVDAKDVRDVKAVVGNLQVLYLDLPTYEDNDFTSWHQRGKHTIKIGGIYKIGDNEINLNNGLCAAGGLHAAAVDYNYGDFDDTPIVVLVYPSKAITVPIGETGKLRTTEMFIAAINDKPHGQHFDEGALFSFDEEYHDLTLQELEEAVSKKSFEGLAVKDEVPAVSLVDLATIKLLLKDRVQKVV